MKSALLILGSCVLGLVAVYMVGRLVTAGVLQTYEDWKNKQHKKEKEHGQ
jgi:hypothetical protein